KAAHWDCVRRVGHLPAHGDHRELPRSRSRLERYQGEGPGDPLELADGAVTGPEAAALERAVGAQAVVADLVAGYRRGAQLEHGVDAGLVVHRDRHLDVRKARRTGHQAAVEMLRLPAADLEVERELLLERELPADP